MITAIDTNVLVSLWKANEKTSDRAASALNSAASKGGVMVCGVVFAELLAYPTRTESFIYDFCLDTGIVIDWTITRSMWVAAGRSFQAHAIRRQKHKADAPRQILADFLIGSYAAENGYRLLTLDERIFKAAFPQLEIIIC